MNHFDNVQQFLNVSAPVWIPAAGFMLLLVVFWSLFWKGLALWHSAQRGQPWWFFVMLIINFAGIPEIIYLFFIAKIKPRDLFSNHGHHHD